MSFESGENLRPIDGANASDRKMFYIRYHSLPPRQFDPGRFVHRDGRTARIAEDNLPAFHLRRNLHVVRGGEEAARMTVQHVGVALPVDVDPAF